MASIVAKCGPKWRAIVALVEKCHVRSQNATNLEKKIVVHLGRRFKSLSRPPGPTAGPADGRYR